MVGNFVEAVIMQQGTCVHNVLMGCQSERKLCLLY